MARRSYGDNDIVRFTGYLAAAAGLTFPKAHTTAFETFGAFDPELALSGIPQMDRDANGSVRPVLPAPPLRGSDELEGADTWLPLASPLPTPGKAPNGLPCRRSGFHANGFVAESDALHALCGEPPP